MSGAVLSLRDHYVDLDPSAPQGVPQFALAAFADACRELGISFDALHVLAAGEPFSLHPRATLLRALGEVRTREPDRLLARSIASAMNDTRLHVLGPLMTAGATARQVVQVIAEHRRTIFGGDAWQIWRERDRLFFGCAKEEEHEAGGLLEAQVVVVLACRRLLQFWGDWCRPLLQVTLIEDEPLPDDDSLVDVSVTYRAPLNTISFPEKLLDYRRPSTDPALGQAMARVLRDSVDAKLASWTEEVTGALMTAGHPAHLDAQATARALGVSTRTLRRRLEEEDTSWSVLHEKILFARARELLLRPRASAHEVARQLGYNELSSFSRAFKRWSGIGPREFQRAERQARTSARVGSPQ